MDERKAFVEWARQVRVWEIADFEAVWLAWQAATAAERERCAKACEQWNATHPDRLAAEIRKG